MQQPIENYWRIRLNDVKESLEANGFDAFIAGSPEEAKRIFFEEILPESGAKSVSWGGSMTIRAVGVHEAVMNKGSLDVLNPDDPTLSPDERLERRRQALLVDIYLTGTNAVIETGQLVNLDAFGNRVGALVFGPKNVVVFVGRNKITADLESAMARIKEYVAPINCMRLDRKTPCATTGLCQDCASPDRNLLGLDDYRKIPSKRANQGNFDQSGFGILIESDVTQAAVFLTPKGCDDCRDHDAGMFIERRRRNMLRQARNMPRLRR